MAAVAGEPWGVRTRQRDVERGMERGTECHLAHGYSWGNSVGFFGFRSRPENNDYFLQI